jgi:hypothetical protein
MGHRFLYKLKIMWKRILLISIVLILIVFLAKAFYGIATAPPLGAHFPQEIKPPSVYIDTLWIEGKLVLDNGCLRVSRAKNLLAGDNFLLIWDPRFSTRTEQGIVQVIDSGTGEVLASVGDFVTIGDGGDLTNPTWLWLKQPIPNECPGPYWVIGESIKKIDRP